MLNDQNSWNNKRKRLANQLLSILFVRVLWKVMTHKYYLTSIVSYINLKS